jgi:hypothetical protein
MSRNKLGTFTCAVFFQRVGYLCIMVVQLHEGQKITEYDKLKWHKPGRQLVKFKAVFGQRINLTRQNLKLHKRV